MNGAELADTLFLAVKQYVDKSNAPWLKRIDELEQRLASMPAPKDGRDGVDGKDGVPGKDGTAGFTPEPELIIEMVRANVGLAIEALPKAKDGVDGKDGASVNVADVRPLIESMVLDGLAKIDPPKDGQDGKDGVDGINGKDGANGSDADPSVTQALIDAKVKEYVALIPLPKDGENGKDVDPLEVQRMVSDAVAAIPKAIDGKDGAPGKDADMEEIAKGVRHIVATSIAELPKPVDGKDGSNGRDGINGKDAVVDEPWLKSMIVGMIPAPIHGKDGANGLNGLPGRDGQDGIHGQDGKDGAIGRDGIEVDVLHAIDPTRTYQRGTVVRHKGGTIRAFRDTLPLTDDLEACGWHVTQEGVDEIVIEQGDDLRTFGLSVRKTSGQLSKKSFELPVVLYQGVFRDGEKYAKGDAVTRGGSLWIAKRDTTSSPSTPGVEDWQLSVKKGSDGRDGWPAVPLEPAKQVRLK